MADNHIMRLIQKWLKAGVMEECRWENTEMGTPQGAVISPLLANRDVDRLQPRHELEAQGGKMQRRAP